MRILSTAAIFFSLLVAPTVAQTIEGQWRVQNGETVTYRVCPQGFCSVIDSGEYAGGTVGWMAPGPRRYEGSVVDPTSGTAYDGHASVEGDVLTLTGCVAKIFCRSQVWTR